jgi:deoxyribodipyrimidine photo-lyase
MMTYRGNGPWVERPAGGWQRASRGRTADELRGIVEGTCAIGVYFTRSYEPWAVALEDDLKENFAVVGVSFRRFGGRLLREPEDVRTASGESYAVYTPFWRKFCGGFTPAKPLPAPEHLDWAAAMRRSDGLADWDLSPVKPDWSGGVDECWTPGEAGAGARLSAFLETKF